MVIMVDSTASKHSKERSDLAFSRCWIALVLNPRTIHDERKMTVTPSSCVACFASYYLRIFRQVLNLIDTQVFEKAIHLAWCFVCDGIERIATQLIATTP